MSDEISDELKDRARMTREDGSFTLKLDEGLSLALLTDFAEDMFPACPSTILASGRRAMANLSCQSAATGLCRPTDSFTYACALDLGTNPARDRFLLPERALPPARWPDRPS
jgi:hypothetical protein